MPAAPSVPDGSLINEDLAPTPLGQRTWNRWHIASLWVGMSVCIPTYMLAASLVESGMNWWQSLITIILGNMIVLVPLVLNGHAGTKFGIPFPIYARASFGILGAHIPSLLRSLVACGWFGIQTWIGGLAIYEILNILWDGWAHLGGAWLFMGYSLSHYICFMLFWAVNMYFVWAGTETIKWLETLAAPFLILTGLALLFWAIAKVGSLATILEESGTLITVQEERTFFQFAFSLFLPGLTAMVGFWATLSLNIPDFTRYAKSQKDQMLGQGVGLLTTMPLFAFIGVAVTSATVILYGEAIWNPIDLLSRMTAEAGSPVLGLLALVVLAIATLSTNIAANVVAPAISISNVAPRKISFKLGGFIAGAIGIVILPWKLLDMYLTWLITYSGLLGAVGGIILCDYVLLRRFELDASSLYTADGSYWYQRGVNREALIALIAGVLCALLGKLHPSLSFLFNGAWFSATIVSFAVYYMLMRRRSSQLLPKIKIK